MTAYITRCTRWRAEETIRHVKQAYSLKDIRLLRCRHLKNMAAIVGDDCHVLAHLVTAAGDDALALLNSLFDELPVSADSPAPEGLPLGRAVGAAIAQRPLTNL